MRKLRVFVDDRMVHVDEVVHRRYFLNGFVQQIRIAVVKRAPVQKRKDGSPDFSQNLFLLFGGRDDVQALGAKVVNEMGSI